MGRNNNQDSHAAGRKVRAQLRSQAKQRKQQWGDSEWKNDLDRFSSQLSTIGLFVRDVAGDGNCLFRAVSDQMCGNAEGHGGVRAQCCDYLEAFPELFAPFVPDDLTFQQYVEQMRIPKTWGGNIELQALSLALNVNFVIHQLDQPRWVLENHPPDARIAHLGYHNGDHYTSVRELGSLTGVPPRVTPADLEKRESTASVGKSGFSGGSGSATRASSAVSQAEQLCMLSTSQPLPVVREILAEYNGDVDSAIEYLIAVANAPMESFSVEDHCHGAAVVGTSQQTAFCTEKAELRAPQTQPAPCNARDNNNSSSSTAQALPVPDNITQLHDRHAGLTLQCDMLTAALCEDGYGEPGDMLEALEAVRLELETLDIRIREAESSGDNYCRGLEAAHAFDGSALSQMERDEKLAFELSMSEDPCASASSAPRSASNRSARTKLPPVVVDRTLSKRERRRLAKTGEVPAVRRAESSEPTNAQRKRAPSPGNVVPKHETNKQRKARLAQERLERTQADRRGERAANADSSITPAAERTESFATGTIGI